MAVILTGSDVRGAVLVPGESHLGSAVAVDGPRHAVTRHVGRSGLRIRHSAPLGHSGALFPWALGIRTAAPPRTCSGMVTGEHVEFRSTAAARPSAEDDPRASGHELVDAAPDAL